MRHDFWTDDVAALALITPVDRIDINELTCATLRRLRVVIDEIHDDSFQPSGFEPRYWGLRHILEGAETAA